MQYLDSARTVLMPQPIHVISEKGGTPVEVALEYNTDYQEHIYSYVNNINTIEGGTHVAGFRSALTPHAQELRRQVGDAGEGQGGDFRRRLPRGPHGRDFGEGAGTPV